MTLVDALLVLARRRPNATVVDYRAAYDLVDGVCHDEARRFPLLDAASQDDVAAEACINTVRAVELHRLDPESAGEGGCRAYSRRAARNLAITALRRGAVARPESDEILERLLVCVEPDDDEAALPDRAALVGHVVAILEALMSDALAQRPARYRQSLADAFSQLRQIAFEGRTITHFIPPNLAESARRTERLRLQQAHSRCREALALAVTRRQQDGRMTAQGAGRARACVLLLYSCQPPDGARVQGVKP